MPAFESLQKHEAGGIMGKLNLTIDIENIVLLHHSYSWPNISTETKSILSCLDSYALKFICPTRGTTNQEVMAIW